MAHEQEARACCAKMDSNNVMILDLGPSCSVGVEGVFVGTLSPVKSSRRSKDYLLFLSH